MLSDMSVLVQDIRFGIRLLLRNPGFTVVAVLSLALGIGANTTIFTLVDAVLLRPLPVAEPERLVALFTTDSRIAGPFGTLMPTSRLNFVDYREENDAFAEMAAIGNVPLAFSGRGEPEQVFGEIVSGSFFALLGVRPALGRSFLPDEDQIPGAKLVTVLSHSFWQRRLGGDPAVVGSAITLNGHAFTVVGVAPPGFQGTNATFSPALWVPYMAWPQVTSGFVREGLENRRALLFRVVGRLKPGASLAGAEAGLQTIAARLEREYPEPNAGRSIALLPLTEATINPGFRQNIVSAASLLMAVVGLVLLIACANVANLLLARAAVRQREVAVRLSVGASRGRLVRQLLTEGLLLALAAGLLGTLIAYWAQGLLWSASPPAVPADALDFAPGGRVLAFTALVSLLTAVVFGLAPALRASRPNVVEELKQRGGPAIGGNRPLSLRNLLVAGQVALSLVALVGAGLFVRSLARAQEIDPGFDHEKLAVLTADLGAQGYDAARAREFRERMLERAGALPGVERATLATGIPLFQGGFLRTVFPEGTDSSDRAKGKLVQLSTVEPGYFETMGIRLRQGRGFSATDREGSPRVAVVNETMAKQFWPDGDAVGRRFKFFGQDWWNEVVGIAADGKYNFIGENPQPFLYLALGQSPEPAVSLFLRTRGEPAAALGLARKEVQEMDRTLPLTNVFTFGEILRQALWAPRMGAWLLAIFGLLSLLLAVVGIYGVLSYAVKQRTRELGVRMALGADERSLLRLVVGQALGLVGSGIAIGLALSLAVSRLAANLLLGVSSHDPLTFAGVPLLLAVASLAATALPAWRATRVDPTVALRSE
jgi:predicted permease